MGLEFMNKLPTPTKIREQFPLPAQLADVKTKQDEEIKKVLTGESDKFLVIIGPCPVDNEDAVCDYISRLVPVQERVKDKIIIIPRVYTNKPRTIDEGYRGLLHQPNPEKKPDIYEDLIATRRTHIRVVQETGLTTADEVLHPENVRYLSDLMSYIAVGACSVENRQHRLVASGCDVPIGMKNPASGDLSVVLNSVMAAQGSHKFIFRGWEVHTPGNPLAYVILRGAANKHGQCIPNYHSEDLILLHELYGKRNLQNPACIVDANHSNSNKMCHEQIRITKEVLHSRRHAKEVSDMVKGITIESYIEPGYQKAGEHCYNKSITDPCLGWEDSERLIYEIAEGLN